MKRWTLKTKSLADVSKSEPRPQPVPGKPDDPINVTSGPQKTKGMNERVKVPLKTLKTFTSLDEGYDQENLNQGTEARNLLVSRSGRFKEKQRMRVRVLSIDGESLMTAEPQPVTRDRPFKPPSSGDAMVSKNSFHDTFRPPQLDDKQQQQQQQQKPQQQQLPQQRQMQPPAQQRYQSASFPCKPKPTPENRLRPPNYTVLTLAGVEGNTSQL